MIITIIVLGLVFNLVVEGVLFFIAFSLVRTYAGGYHCKSGITCYIMSSAIVPLFFISLKIINMEYAILANSTILLVSVPVILKFAPVGSSNKQLDEAEQVHFRKK